MSDLGIRQQPTTTIYLPEMFHQTCCEDDNLGLCGTDVTDLPWTDGFGEEPCLVCADLLHQTPILCPRTGGWCW